MISDYKIYGSDGVEYEVTYIDRDGWDSDQPLTAGYSVPLAQFIAWVLHHTVMIMPDYDRDGFLHGDLDDVCRYMRVLQHIRPDLGDEVPYSFVVFRGRHARHAIICEGRGYGRTGAHTAGLNSTRYAWSIAGDLRTEGLTPGMIQAMRWQAAVHTPWVTIPTIGHRQAPPYYQNGVNLNGTECPADAGIRATHLLQPMFKVNPPPVKDWFDMATKEDLRAVIREEVSEQLGEVFRQLVGKPYKKGGTWPRALRDAIGGDGESSLWGRLTDVWNKVK